MINTIIHRSNIALKRWNNSIAKKHKVRWQFILPTQSKIGLLVFLGAISTYSAADEPTFQIGRFSDNPKKEIPLMQPMAKYLADKMQSFGYETGEAEVFVSFDRARDALENGGLDIMTCGLYEAAELIRTGHALPLTIKWKREMPEYSSLIIVKADSDIYELSDLIGKSLGFEDPGSSSAYFIPFSKILDQQFPIAEYNADILDPAVINFRFTGSEQNSSALLFQDKVDAIALSDYDWLRSNNIPENQRGSFRIIWISEPYPRAIEVVRSNMPSEQISYLQNELIKAHLDPAAEQIIESYHEAARFTLLKESDLQQLNELISFIEALEQAE